jgi:hypothetical protein
MKILFLDFDGVINACESTDLVTLQSNDIDSYSPILIANINRLTDVCNFKIVVSSSWRKLYDFQTLQIVCKSMGLTAEVVGSTTCKDLVPEEHRKRAGLIARGLQISDWLANNTCEDYYVLDDDSDASYQHETKFLKIDNSYGFTAEVADNLIKKLQGCQND